jgi:hypothetical protein
VAAWQVAQAFDLAGITNEGYRVLSCLGMAARQKCRRVTITLLDGTVFILHSKGVYSCAQHEPSSRICHMNDEEPTKKRIAVILGSGFSAALTSGDSPILGSQPLPTLNNLTDAVLSHVKFLQAKPGALQFSTATVQQVIAVLEKNIARPGNERYSFEELLSLLAIESSISQGSLSPVLSDLPGANPQILRCILFCLSHLFATRLSCDGSHRANRNFWYKVNAPDRAREFKEGLWRLVDEHDVTFISFNYDGLIEAFLDWWIGDTNQQQRGYRYLVELSHALPITSPEHVFARPDMRDFVKVSKPPLVLKPHGSIHFFQLRPELKGLTGGPTLVGLHPRLDIGFNPATSQRDIADIRFWEFADPVPVIIPPLLSKESYLGGDYFQTMLRLIVEAVQQTDRVLVIGFSLPPSDLHVCAAFGAINWSDKKLGLVFRKGPADETEMHWRRVAGGQTISMTMDTGVPLESRDSVKSFWKSVYDFLN